MEPIIKAFINDNLLYGAISFLSSHHRNSGRCIKIVGFAYDRRDVKPAEIFHITIWESHDLAPFTNEELMVSIAEYYNRKKIFNLSHYMSITPPATLEYTDLKDIIFNLAVGDMFSREESKAHILREKFGKIWQKINDSGYNAEPVADFRDDICKMDTKHYVVHEESSMYELEGFLTLENAPSK